MIPNEAMTALRKARAALVAQYSFQQRLQRIEWEDTVMKPELERLSAQIGLSGEIPIFEIEADENPSND